MKYAPYSPRLFQQRMWMQSAASIYSFFGGLLALYWIWMGESLWWLCATVVGYFLLVACLSVGNHRLFTHRVYRTSKFWEVFFALAGTLAWSGSPIQWRSLHTTHHRYADTDRDPHVTTPDYFFYKRYKPVPLNVLAIRRLMRDPFHKALHFYYALVPLSIMISLLLIDERLLVFGVFLALTLFNIVGTFHQVISHAPDKHGVVRPRDIAWLEYILPFGGEWMHGKHHEDSKAWNLATRWWHFDMGAWMIRLIGTPIEKQVKA